MPAYLIQALYTSQAWGAQVRHPQNVVERIESAITKLGGRIESVYYSFGEYDIIALVHFPDNQRAAGFELAVSAGGAVQRIHTTPLLTVEEALGAMRQAAGSTYRPPSGLETAEHADMVSEGGPVYPQPSE